MYEFATNVKTIQWQNNGEISDEKKCAESHAWWQTKYEFIALMVNMQIHGNFSKIHTCRDIIIKHMNNGKPVKSPHHIDYKLYSLQ